jgi:hypothetical protein
MNGGTAEEYARQFNVVVSKLRGWDYPGISTEVRQDIDSMVERHMVMYVAGLDRFALGGRDPRVVESVANQMTNLWWTGV